MKFCFATNNIHKLEEIQALLGNSFELLTLEEIGCHEDIAEPFDTITENSYEKARYVWNNYGVNCFADDTGLEVTALNGEPGVKSARYAGEERSAEANMKLLLEKLAAHPDHSARFLTVITAVIGGAYYQFEGIVNGHIVFEKRGNKGFGYDPIFVPEGNEKTFAEMSMEEKSTMSHRARAFFKLKEFLKEL